MTCERTQRVTTIKKNGMLPAVGLLALLQAVPAIAENSLITTPYQIAITTGGLVPEHLRGLSPGAIGRISLGLPLRPGAYVDVNVFGANAAGKTFGAYQSGNETTLGGGLDLRLERLGDLLDYILIFGGGYSNAQRKGVSINAPYVNIGWGLGYELTPTLALRGEVRGMARLNRAFIADRGVTYDAIASVGLVYSFGQAAAAATPWPNSAPVVPSSLPATPPDRLEVAIEPSPEPPVPPLPSVAAAAAAAASLPSRAVAPPAVAVAPKVVPRVLSAQDACPTAPKSAATDAAGCLVPQELWLSGDDFFDSLASVRLLPSGDAALSAIAESLIKNPALHVEISVNADSLEYGADNYKAAVQLSNLLTRRLFELGVPAVRITDAGVSQSSTAGKKKTASVVDKTHRVHVRLVLR
jgi:hypothetical protein